ncbi:MAG: hypothetical protein HOE61_05435 [Candidatus Marinimicrobia bacterium]|jgi:hypothetical protein|nr:hypothetical protein [Candidatus Neomarinimicrobiota bacterium]
MRFFNANKEGIVMKREELNNVNLEAAASEIFQKANEQILSIASFFRSNIKPQLASEYECRSLNIIWSYASSADECMLTDEGGSLHYEIGEDVLEVRTILNKGIYGEVPLLSEHYKDSNIEYACRVAIARLSLDECMAISPEDLSFLADREKITIQQACQRKKLMCFKDGRNWLIPPLEAMKYLQEIGSKPFIYYDIDEYEYRCNEKHIDMSKYI